jgi:uncharacterized protein YjcR
VSFLYFQNKQLSGVGDYVMARARSPNRDKAFELWRESQGDKPLKDIAADLGVNADQVRRWKKQDSWSLEGSNSHVTKSKSHVTIQKPRKNKGGAPKGNNNAAGHGAPPGNQNATKHGFYAKHMPDDVLDILDDLESKSPTDILWDQIQIQYVAIIRSQRIMYVADQEDTNSFTTKEVLVEGGANKEYEIHASWDKQATFLNAQSRAMAELRSLIKQFIDLADNEDERLMKLEKMQLGIKKTKAEIEVIEAKANTGGEGEEKTIIVTNEDEMRAYLDEQSKSNTDN